jgi:hypothetical protein
LLRLAAELSLKNITEDMLRFQEAARHVWNAYLLELTDPMSPELQRSFDKIERELFRALVLLSNGMPDLADKYRRGPLPILLQANTGLTEIPVQFGSLDANRNMRWELPCSTSVTEVSQYQFIAFFDWNPYGYIDMSYIKALCPVDGRFALIEQTYCGFALVNSGA